MRATLGLSLRPINATIWRDKENRKVGVNRGVSDKQDLFSLPTGSVLQIQATVPEDAPRYSVRLIGSLPGASLVITTPTVDGKLQIIREGQRFAVRVLKGERVFGFVARVLFASMKPYPHLHLEYPEEFEQIVVRNSSRVSTDLPAQVRNTADPNEAGSFSAAKLVDLSETGAKLASGHAIAQANEMLHLRFDLTIGSVNEEVSLLAEVRNIAERSEEGADSERLVRYYGLQFGTLSRYQQVLLNAWVTNQALQKTLRAQHA